MSKKQLTPEKQSKIDERLEQIEQRNTEKEHKRSD